MSEQKDMEGIGHSSKILPVGIVLLVLCWATIFAFKDKQEAPAPPPDQPEEEEMERPANFTHGTGSSTSRQGLFANAPKPGYTHPRMKRETAFDRNQEIQEATFVQETPESVSPNRTVEAQLALRKTASNPPPELRKVLKAPAKGWKQHKAEPLQLPESAMIALREMEKSTDLEAMLEQQAKNLREALAEQGEEYDGPSLKEIEEMERKKNVLSF